MLNPRVELETAPLDTRSSEATTLTQDITSLPRVARPSLYATETPSPTRPSPTLETANIARASARRYRAEWLISITEGLVNPFELIEQAATDLGRPLRKLSLRQVLLAQPGWGKVMTAPRLEMLRNTLKASSDERLTVGWLIDFRAGGRRYLTFLDVFTATKTQSPWPGFPFADAPLSVQRNSIYDWATKDDT